jgi:hypothetical protein
VNGERTYACPRCLDEGFTHHRPAMVVSQHSGKRIPAGGAMTARFCSCRLGLAIESGFWADRLRPKKGERTAGDEVKARFLERQRSHPDGYELRSRVERLLKQELEVGDGPGA